MLSNARVQGRHSVEPGSEGAPQLSHGPTVRATVGASDGSIASAAGGASVAFPPQNGQNLAPSTTVVWQWSQCTRISPSPVQALTLLASDSVVASSLPRGWDAEATAWSARDEAAGARRPVRRRAPGTPPGDEDNPASVTIFVTDGQETTLRRAGCRWSDPPASPRSAWRRPQMGSRMTALATWHERERDGMGSAGDARDRTRPAGGTLRRRRTRWSASRAVDIGPHRR